MMKKIIATVVALMACTVLFAGCSAGMKDGSYKAENKDFDSHGWKDFVTVSVVDGKIAEVDYDSINEAGVLKSTDPAYRESMEPVSGTYPEKFSAELEAQLVEKQEPKKVNTVAGATNSSDSFKILATELISKGIQKGNSETIIVG